MESLPKRRSVLTEQEVRKSWLWLLSRAAGSGSWGHCLTWLALWDDEYRSLVRVPELPSAAVMHLLQDGTDQSNTTCSSYLVEWMRFMLACSLMNEMQSHKQAGHEKMTAHL